MISYKPLFHTMLDKNVTFEQLRNDKVISAITQAKFKKGESIMLSTAERICKYLNCNIQDIVTFEKLDS